MAHQQSTYSKKIEDTISELNKNVTRIEINHNTYYSEDRIEGGIAFLFSGQGSQYVNMGMELVMQYDEALIPWNKASGLALDKNKFLNEIVFPVPVFDQQGLDAQTATLLKTEWAQPAIGAIALSHFNLLSKLNVKPNVVGGHSYGELVALFVAGVITNEEDLLLISRKRGELMAAAAAGEQGAMTAVFGDLKEIEAILAKVDDKVEIANINSPKQTVITGTLTAIEKAEIEIAKTGLHHKRLNVSTAFHSSLVSGSSGKFEDYLKGITFGKSELPVYSNITGQPYPENDLDYAGSLAEQLASTVQFVAKIQSMYKAGIRKFIEVGPGKTLSKFVNDILEDSPHVAVHMDGGKKMHSKDAFWCALGQLAVAGVPITFSEIWKDLDETKKTVVEKKPSIATVKINGCNYGRPYPPVGGFKNLPKPNPDAKESDSRLYIPAEKIKEQNNIDTVLTETQSSISNKPQSFPTNIQQSSNKATISSILNNSLNNNKTIQDHKMNQVNNKLLDTFQEIQRNTLEAQKAFQETLSRSHQLFLETSQTAFQQLGNMHSNRYDNIISKPVSVAKENGQSLVYEPQVQPYVSSVPIDAKSNGHARPAQITEEKKVIQETQVIARPEPVMKQKGPVKTEILDFEDTLLNIVSEKTGYPKEILDLDTDLESGLGIDSIKRVEILSALQEAFPVLKEVNTARLAAMNTLSEILSFAKENAPGNLPEVNGKKPGGEISINVAADISSPNLEEFENLLLEIVADKTGYPKEILELDTDLESGLGIDSIKRVEILSALQEKYPTLKNADNARLAAMNTLGEILLFSKEFHQAEGIPTQKKKPSPVLI